MTRRRTNSIRWRIQRWYAILLALIAVAITVGATLYQASSLKEGIATDLASKATAIIPRLAPPGENPRPRLPRRGRPPPPMRPPPNHEGQAFRSVGDILSDPDMYFLFWESDGSLARKSPNAPLEVAYPEFEGGLAETIIVESNGYIQAIHTLPHLQKVVVGYPISTLNATLWIFSAKVALGSALLVLVGGLVGWSLLGRETRKISEIASTAERIAHGNLSERIQADDASIELEELTDVLNATFSKLETSFERQVRFTADASHELRTPLTAILTRCQLTLAKDRTAEKYKEAFASCLEAAQHMKRIVESLLEVARIDSGEAELNLQETNLQDLVAESIEMLRALIEEKFITIETSFERFPVTVDVARIQQVCINLIANAVKYSPPGTTVSISVSKQDDHARIVVADEGHGIPEPDMLNLFDRFYRGENARDQGGDSSGLGLAVSKSIIGAHGGTIQASNRSSKGALFKIELPLEPSKTEIETAPA